MRSRLQVSYVRSRFAAVALVLWLVATLLPVAHGQTPPPKLAGPPGVIVTPPGSGNRRPRSAAPGAIPHGRGGARRRVPARWLHDDRQCRV